MPAGTGAAQEMPSGTRALWLHVLHCCLGVQEKMLRVEWLREKEQTFLQGRSFLKTQGHLHSWVLFLGSPGSPTTGSSCCKAKTTTSFSQIQGSGRQRTQPLVFLPDFRCRVPKDVVWMASGNRKRRCRCFLAHL